MQKKIFVYGSLMKDFFNYNIYLKGKVIDTKIARVKGKLFHLSSKGYPALLEGNDYVYGELLIVDDYDNTLKELDSLEKYYGENNIDNEYNRLAKKVEVISENTIEEAYIYMYNYKDRNKLEKNNIYLPYGDWRRYMENKNKMIV